MFLHFAKLWNWEITEADNWYCPLCFHIFPSYQTGKLVQQITDTVPYVSTFCQVMKLGNHWSRWLILSLMFPHFAKLSNWEISAADNWYCLLFFYILPSYHTRKLVPQITDTVPYVSTFCQVMKLGNHRSRWLILSLMFPHFAKLSNWEISAADNWYCLLFFYILPSYQTRKLVQQITDTVPYVSTFCQVMKLGNHWSRWLILSLMFPHFAKLSNWDISAADNWYCPFFFYIMPSYETGKSLKQITDTVPYLSTFCQVIKLGNHWTR